VPPVTSTLVLITDTGPFNGLTNVIALPLYVRLNVTPPEETVNVSPAI